jgi:hypothetical protein
MTSSPEKQVLDQAFRLVRSIVWPKCHEGVGGTRQRRSGIGNIAVPDHIEPAQVNWPLQARQALKHHGFDSVAGLLGIGEQFAGLTGVGAIEAGLNGRRRQNVKDEAGEVI